MNSSDGCRKGTDKLESFWLPLDVMMFPYDQQDESLLLTRLVELGMAVFVDHNMNSGELLRSIASNRENQRGIGAV
jgi:hypothetical protein